MPKERIYSGCDELVRLGFSVLDEVAEVGASGVHCVAADALAKEEEEEPGVEGEVVEGDGEDLVREEVV